MSRRRTEGQVKLAFRIPGSLSVTRGIDPSKLLLQRRHDRRRKSNATHYISLTAAVGGLSAAEVYEVVLRMCVQNLKFVALPVPEIMRRTQKLGQSLGVHAPFFPKFLMVFTVRQHSLLCRALY